MNDICDYCKDKVSNISSDLINTHWEYTNDHWPHELIDHFDAKVIPKYKDKDNYIIQIVFKIC